MSYVLSLYDGPAPRSFDEAQQFLEDHESAHERSEPPTPAIADFVAAVLSKWPDIMDDDGIDSPWADGPMIGNAAGPTIHFSIMYSRLEDTVPYVIDVAQQRGLVLVDLAEERVLVPAVAASTTTASAQAAPAKKRRFWSRRD